MKVDLSKIVTLGITQDLSNFDFNRLKAYAEVEAVSNVIATCGMVRDSRILDEIVQYQYFSSITDGNIIALREELRKVSPKLYL